MQSKFELYINKSMKPYFDMLEAQGNIEGISFNRKLGEAVEFYIKEKNGRLDLIADKKAWKIQLNKMNKEELIEANRLINELNNMILRALYV